MKNILFYFILLSFIPNCRINPPCSILDSSCNILGYIIPDLITRSRTSSTPSGAGTGVASTVTFTGLSNLRILSSTSVELRWTAATSTAAGAIEYNIYRSATSGAQVFTTPLQTVNNVTTVTLTGITANTNNYYVVRARDSAGTVDTNTSERAALFNGLIRFIPLDATPLATGEKIGNGVVTAFATPSVTSTDRLGNVNNAYTLNGSTQYFTFSVSGLPSGSSNRTACGWARFNNLSGVQRIVSYGNNVAEQEFSILKEGAAGTRLITLFTASAPAPQNSRVNIPSAELITGAWNFYCVTLTSPATANIFFNGTNRLTGEQGSTPATGNTSAMIGASVGPGDYLNGSVSEVSIWDRVLTSAEILTVFRN